MFKAELLTNPTSLFFISRAKAISRPCDAWRYINSDLFSGKDAAVQVHWPRDQVSAEEEIKQINHNPAKRSLSSFVLGQLIRRTSSPETTLFMDCKRKIRPVIQKQAGQQSLPASGLTSLRFGAVSAATPSLSLHAGWWNEVTPKVTEWNSSLWTRWGRQPRAPGPLACLFVSRKRRPGGGAVDTSGGASSRRQDSPGGYLQA